MSQIVSIGRLILFFISSFGYWELFRKKSKIFSASESSAERLWIEKAVDQYGIAPQKSYVICIPSIDSGYALYLCRYLFYSTQVSNRIITEENQLEDAANYDYVLLYDSENEIIQKWVSEYFPDQAGQDVIIVG